MEAIRAFKASDGKLFETAAEAKRHEARLVLLSVLTADRIGPHREPVIDLLLDHAGSIGAALSEMARADVQPAASAPVPAKPMATEGGGK